MDFRVLKPSVTEEKKKKIQTQHDWREPGGSQVANVPAAVIEVIFHNIFLGRKTNWGKATRCDFGLLDKAGKRNS